MELRPGRSIARRAIGALRVPLCERAVEVMHVARPTVKYGFLFPGCAEGRPLSNQTTATHDGRLGPIVHAGTR
ncbi:hypothetical protein BVI434_1290018 [Burkholderia vietnamiensis]|nr:hypothetical protein BVI434_1290018 [Burkholderia vietnamiensis]